jgi:hypothetical protein
MRPSRWSAEFQIVLSGIFLLAACSSLRAQEDDTSKVLAQLRISDNLRPTKAAFVHLDRCRIQLPDSDLKLRLSHAEESLIEGLLMGWDPAWRKKWHQPHYVPLKEAFANSQAPSLHAAAALTSPPEAYLRSLENDAAVCNAVAAGPQKSADTAAKLATVVRDLELKFRDCYLHGMGRLVPVEVATKKGQLPDPGWTVYFKWVTVSDLPTTETPFRTSSTPARDDLPPGVYQLRAERAASPSVLNSEIKTVDLSGENSKCELQVP